MRLVDVGGRLVEVHVRVSPRAQRVRAVWKPGEPVELIVPVGTHERAVDRALGSHAPWIGRQVETIMRGSWLRQPLAPARQRPAARASRSHGDGDARGGAPRRHVHADHDPGHTLPLGILLDDRNALVQLAACARTARDPRLRRRARALPPPPSRPLEAFLDARRGGVAGLSPAQGLAGRPRVGVACVSSSGVTRWATFDCYGTLIDWNGQRAALASVWPDADPDGLLRRYHEFEPRIQAGRASPTGR